MYILPSGTERKGKIAHSFAASPLVVLIRFADFTFSVSSARLPVPASTRMRMIPFSSAPSSMRPS